MSCPTCDHTMQVVVDKLYWCPRCGTIRSMPLGNMHEAPMLVERCRKFDDNGRGLGVQWRTLGIEEAINLPEKRRI